MSNKPILPFTSKRYQLKYRGTVCLNCNHPLDVSDKFCPNCSQANSTKKLTLKDFVDEFFATIISYDSRLLKTLAALLTRPGKITKDYIAGKRVTYTNPFRFLLSLAIIYFIMFNYDRNYTTIDDYGSKFLNEKDSLDNYNFRVFTPNQTYVQQERQELLGHLAKIDSSIIKNEEDFKFLDSITKNSKPVNTDSIVMADPASYYSGISKESGFVKRYFSKVDFFQTLVRKDTVYNFNHLESSYGVTRSIENLTAHKAAQSIIKALREPGSFLKSITSRLPFLIFFFLPLFTVFLWLVYIRKKHTYTEHLIFSFHNQSLFLILLIISFVIDSIFDTNTSWIVLWVFSYYLFRAMKNFYQQGTFKTIIKYFYINIVFFTLAAASVGFILLISALTY